MRCASRSPVPLEAELLNREYFCTHEQAGYLHDSFDATSAALHLLGCDAGRARADVVPLYARLFY
jgi:hypothetical protein